jgi:fructose-specific phosphotransferase system IIB component
LIIIITGGIGVKLIAVTACPAGIAHTNIAARALEKSAEKLGLEIKVERQGALGIQNKLTEKDILDAGVVIFAVDQKVIEDNRFLGKLVYTVSVTAPIRDGVSVIKSAVGLIK